MRARKITRYGNTDVIRLKPQDKDDMGFDYGDEVDIDKCRKLKRPKTI